jgi:GT2 family glycosyltransferase
MAQGACQFCRRNVFLELGGFDETQYMGEDVDFYWRLKRLARQRGLRTSFIRELQVIPSPRRFDRWPVWRCLVWTNPFLTLALRHRKAAWRGWYGEAPR